MYDALFPQETEQALADRARNPLPPAPRKPSFWEQTAEFLSAVPEGAAQGINETGRLAVRMATARAEPDPADRRAVGDALSILPTAPIQQERARSAQRTAEMRRDGDEFFRRNVEYWRPDPVASTTGSLILRDLSRQVTKLSGYVLTGGPMAGAVGLGIDEGFTGYAELRDRGVDERTAASVGAVRGVSAAVGVALPAAGTTVARTVGLVAVGGPGSVVAERYVSREILERANYPELAAEHDPWDPVAVGVATLLSGAVGVGVHVGRARAERQAADAAQPATEPPLAAVADDPAVVDAAHAVYRAETLEVSTLGDRADPAARAEHVRAIEDAARALDAGDPIQVNLRTIDAERAQRVLQEVEQRMRAAETQARAARDLDPDASLVQTQPPEASLTPTQDAPAVADMADAADMPPAPLEVLAERLRDFLGVERAPARNDGQADPSAPVQRAQRIAAERPDLPVRMEDDGPVMRADDAVTAAREEATRNRTERRAFEAAVECAIRNGE